MDEGTRFVDEGIAEGEEEFLRVVKGAFDYAFLPLPLFFSFHLTQTDSLSPRARLYSLPLSPAQTSSTSPTARSSTFSTPSSPTTPPPPPSAPPTSPAPRPSASPRRTSASRRSSGIYCFRRRGDTF